MRLTLRLLAVLAIPLSVFAQTKFGEKVTVTYVEVPVTVLGKDGGPVRGLTKENFELREDGEKRDIESFDAIDFAAADTIKQISPLNPASRRNFLLLFDLSYSNPQAVGRAQDAARNFIARSIGRRDLVGIATVDIDHGFRFVTAFTTDRELLTAAIKDPKNFRSNDPLQIASAKILNIEQQSKTGAGSLGERTDRALENMKDISRLSGRLDEAQSRTRVKRQVEMLAQIAHMLQGLAGRKHVVLLSEGFDPRLVQGRAAGMTDDQKEEDISVEFGELWKVDSDKRFGSAESQRSIQLMAEEFRRSDVVLHAVDIQGVRVANDTQSGAKFNSNEGLFILANSTGGTVFRNSNDITSDFDKLTRQHEVVYVLGFHAPVVKAGQFHDLKVKVNVPGARVQHRGGYYDAGAENVVERSLSTAEIIVNDIPQDDVRFDALAAAFPADDKAQVPVVLEISGEDLVKAAKNDRATTDIFVYAFDADGIVRDQIFQRMTLDMTQVGERLKEAGVRFYGTLHLQPGKYALKSLIRIAETEKKGFRRTELEVPRAGDVAVTRPLFFADAGDWVMVKATGDDPNAPYPFMLGADSFIPAANATLRKGEPRLFTVFVYNAERDELTYEIAPEAKLVSESSADDVTKFLFALERVPADTKELAVTIRKKGSADARRVSVPISVQ